MLEDQEQPEQPELPELPEREATAIAQPHGAAVRAVSEVLRAQPGGAQLKLAEPEQQVAPRSRPAAAQEMSADPAENAVAVVETMKERRLRTLELYTKRQLIHQKDGDPHIG